MTIFMDCLCPGNMRAVYLLLKYSRLLLTKPWGNQFFDKKYQP
jgi:hypothetical protein